MARSGCGKYKKRRYKCPGKRRYKAKNRGPRCRSRRINLCNRNWSRISIHPFINFLRVFRRRFCKGESITKIACKGRAAWRRMSNADKDPYIEQAIRAKHRGFRT
ncbi:hypothetical protein AAG570_001038 [Ranatra chinensis]|uniref:Uncharacterized protein n=1 Tax=Ranatra chinensis TaxID=642074 RepID=A0ABD0YYV4_9HEMI